MRPSPSMAMPQGTGGDCNVIDCFQSFSPFPTSTASMLGTPCGLAPANSTAFLHRAKATLPSHWNSHSGLSATSNFPHPPIVKTGAVGGSAAHRSSAFASIFLKHRILLLLIQTTSRLWADVWSSLLVTVES